MTTTSTTQADHEEFVREDNITDEVVQGIVAFCAPEIKQLEQFALDHYEEGGHWVAETYDKSDYARVLLSVGQHDTMDKLVETAKTYLRRDWEHMNMLEREYAFGDEE